MTVALCYLATLNRASRTEGAEQRSTYRRKPHVTTTATPDEAVAALHFNFHATAACLPSSPTVQSPPDCRHGVRPRRDLRTQSWVVAKQEIQRENGPRMRTSERLDRRHDLQRPMIFPPRLTDL